MPGHTQRKCAVAASRVQNTLEIRHVYLREWMGWARRSQLEPMIKLAKTIKTHEEGILRWFHSKMTNGLLEGINGLVQASKRKARGYRNVNNLIDMARRDCQVKSVTFETRV
ncbi:transposase [Paenibacillus oceani]|uniref:transposase n=1 Tax=Paenibacillus oceani TaxID=2772510 RepID=UPI001CC25F02|nr:transposase [Paenibacillus oceani]